MEVKLVKFGTTLVFRDRGREAFKVFEPGLKALHDNENLEIDFSGVLTFSPSWGDEFICPLFQRYGDRLVLKNTQNSSVVATLSILAEINNYKFNIAS